jgi:ABC-type nitrate/sulfonate/bicarbonate transport system substrate-binding protein
MDRRTFVKATLPLAAAMASPPGFAQGAPETGKLVLGFGSDPVFAPHIVAMEKGWFREAGFNDVTVKTFAGGAIAGEALVAGEISLWTPGNLPPVSMAHSGVPIVVIGNNAIATIADKLVVRKDANVRTPEDLYRIRIGLLQGSTASAMVHYLARHYNLDEKKLQVVNMPPPEQLAALNAGNIQALLCWQPWGYNSLKSGTTSLLHSGTTSYFESNKGAAVQVSYTRSVFVASQEFVRKNPVATRRLTAVLLRGQKYVADRANRDEVVDLFCKVTKQDKTLAAAIWDDYVFQPAFDEGYARDMRAMTSYLVASGRIKTAKDPLEYTYSDPLAAADPALVLLPGRFKA